MHAFCISFHVLRNSGLFSRGWKKDSLKEQMDKGRKIAGAEARQSSTWQGTIQLICEMSNVCQALGLSSKCSVSKASNNSCKTIPVTPGA